MTNTIWAYKCFYGSAMIFFFYQILKPYKDT